MLSWVDSVFQECRDQGKSWDSALTLPVNPCGLADEVADMLDFLIFRTVFMYSLDYWNLIAFPFEVCWSYGCKVPSLLRGSERSRLGLDMNCESLPRQQIPLP